MSKPTDYDSPRRPGFDTGEDGTEELAARGAAARSLGRDLDETEAAETLESSGADASDDELTAPVVPIQSDEFRCTRCFLLHHRSRLAARADGQDVCQECS
jgi:uncharacterized protein DUF4193